MNSCCVGVSSFEVWQGVQACRFGAVASVRVWDSDLEGTAGFGTAEASFLMPWAPVCDQRKLGVDVPACAGWIITETEQIVSGFTSSRVAMLLRSGAVLLLVF